MTAYPQKSTYFSVADIEYHGSVSTTGDGDLWPSTWADDGYLYTANGDGLGFGEGEWLDIVVSRVSGTPSTGISGVRLAGGRAVTPIWTDPERFNAKPTGMIAVDGNRDGKDELYLAVQDLRCGDSPDIFNEAPAAGICRSDDYGKTWIPSTGPVFTDHQFTTVMFLDFGQSNRNAKVLGSSGTDYVYAYGLDHNWRTSLSGCVPDPTELFLGRVPTSAIQSREAWEFFQGIDSDGLPRWGPAMADRQPVLTDTRRCYVPSSMGDFKGETLITQGDVTYFEALDRYIYSSWSHCVWTFYESPTPWGPWKEFIYQDFGPHPWTGPGSADAKFGGYGVTIPSKFISSDGTSAWVQANWFGDASTYTGNAYHFSLRQLHLAIAPDEPANGFGELVPSDQPETEVNLARDGAYPIGVTFRSGHPEVLNDGRIDIAEDSWNDTEKSADFWGYTWATPRRMNRIVYTTGPNDWTSGWFIGPPWVEYRVNGQWVRAAGIAIDPEYPQGFRSTGNRVFTLTFDSVTTTGIKMVGDPTGFGQWYSAIAELEVYFDR